MRSRSRKGDPNRASSFQYLPRYLLYRTDADAILRDTVLCAVARHIGRVLPASLQAPWAAFCAGNRQAADEQAAIPAFEWISQHGGENGFRPPNTRERSRAMGVDAYMDALARCGPLSDRDIYDVQGDAFDPDAVLLRVGAPLLHWLRGGNLATYACPPILHCFAAHSRLLGALRRAGHVPPVTNPFPADLRASLLREGSLLCPAGDGDPPSAAAGRVAP